MRWALAGLIALCAFLASVGVVLCEASVHVRWRTEFSDPPAYLKGSEFDWRDAQIVAADGAILRGWFLEPRPRSGKCIAVLHGIGDSRRGVIGFAPMFLRHGFAVLTPDSRGHGKSGGDVTTYGELEADDVLRWAQWMRGQGCTEVVGLGESLGGAILLQAAGLQAAGKEAGFQGIIAEGAYSSFTAIGEERLGRATKLPLRVAYAAVWPSLNSGMLWAQLRYGMNLWDVNPAVSAGRSTTPILLIHGLADERTAPENSRIIAAAAPRATLWLVPGAGHVGASSTDPAGFETHVFKFLKSLSYLAEKIRK